MACEEFDHRGMEWFPAGGERIGGFLSAFLVLPGDLIHQILDSVKSQQGFPPVKADVGFRQQFIVKEEQTLIYCVFGDSFFPPSLYTENTRLLTLIGKNIV